MTGRMLAMLLEEFETHNPHHLLDLLQERGLVSDEAVRWEEVAEPDALRALAWRRRRRHGN